MPLAPTLGAALAAVPIATFKGAARVTVGSLLLYAGAICYQVYTKVTLYLVHKQQKTKFDRHGGKEPRMVIADRIVGNFIEWSVPSLSLLWIGVVVAPTSNVVAAGWVFMASRALYLVLASGGGLTGNRGIGTRPLIFVATVPMYLSLLHNLAVVCRALT